MSAKSRAVAVLFADICDSMKFYRSAGDREAKAIIDKCLSVLADVSGAHSGRVIKMIGDEIMAEFPSSDHACEASIAMQRENRRGGLAIKIGFHFGSVIDDRDDLFGDAVNMAHRVVERSRAGEILLTEETLAHLSPSLRARAQFFDRSSVKGVGGPVGLYRIHPTAVGHSNDTAGSVLLDATIPVSGTALEGAPKSLSLTLGEVSLRLDRACGPVVMGRSTECNLIVPIASASRRHAVVVWERDRFVIRDQSANGTFVALQGQGVHLLKRESLSLFGSGTISLGVDPNHDAAHEIEFKVVSI
jgi:class 3 adenylate cyclase